MTVYSEQSLREKPEVTFKYIYLILIKIEGERKMKKTLYCLIIIGIIGTCCTTTALAAPEITGVRGGYGVIATVADAADLDWKIEIGGQHIFQGGVTEGVVGNNGSATIRTPIFPPALGIGKINITVWLYWGFLPVAMEERNAFMVGPFVLFMQ